MSVDWYMFKFDITINNVEYRQGIAEDLRIDRTDLDREFCEQPERFAYYATMHELAKDQEARIKKDLDTLYAVIDAEKRATAVQFQATQPKFKYTEKMCENEVKTDERYQAVQNSLLDAKKLTGLLSVAKEAFAQRKEMLISVGANARIGASSVRVLKEQAKEITTRTSK